MVLVIDNYDSFTYNLVQYVGELGVEPKVVRNDAASVEALAAMAPRRIIISPGPGDPHEAGISIQVIEYFKDKCPILGVCLGHQAIGAAFGGQVVRAPQPVHGKASLVHHDGRTIFRGLPNPLTAGRYHSLIVARDSLPEELSISAQTEDGLIMALRHRSLPVEGVQFHPESVLTPEGRQLIKNFIEGGSYDS